MQEHMQLDEEKPPYARAGFNFLQAMPCEATFYLYIKLMCYPKNYCDVSHTDMCTFFNVSRETISKWKESLLKKGFIRKESARGRNTKLYPIFEKNLKETTSQEKLTSLSKTSQEKLTSSSQEKLTSLSKTSQEKLTSSSQEKLTSCTHKTPTATDFGGGHNNIYNNNIYISSIDAQKDNCDEKKAPTTMEEVATYAIERGFDSESAQSIAKRFFDYYDAADWYDAQGRKVKSWKQRFLRWEANEKSQSRQPQPKQPVYYTGDDDVDDYSKY